MAHKVQGKNRDGSPILAPPVAGRPLTAENIQATDPHLKMLPGTEIDKFPGDAGYRITKLAPSLPVVGGTVPDIDLNPYNFVSFAAASPWQMLPRGESHQGHEKWADGYFSGRIRLSGEALTPVFVPEGFPCDSDDRAERRFCRLPRAEEEFFAIPGASLKGVLRSAIEALTNDCLGVVNKEFYKHPIPYRRRSFKAGVIESRGPGFRTVREIEHDYLDAIQFPVQFPVTTGFSYQHDPNERFKRVAAPGRVFFPAPGDIVPFKANLLCQTPVRVKTPVRANKPLVSHRWTHLIIRRTSRTVNLPDHVANTYLDNIGHEHKIGHPHYRRHYEDHAEIYAHLPGMKNVLAELTDLTPGQIVYFTLDKKGDIDSFGKNVNYLWPAARSVEDLAKNYYASDFGLTQHLGLASLMFGFASPHKKYSHPYQGKLRIETLWGAPASTSCVKIQMAPLTAPQTRAKSRPLYLQPGPNGTSASYSDPSSPKLRGRKFYWHQHPEPNAPSGIWAGHVAASEHESVKSQLPPPIQALPAGSKFEGFIHFDNLAPHELGALIYALEGDKTYDHAIKIGKRKPRGLGSLRVRVESLEALDAKRYYASLEETVPLKRIKVELFVDAFRKWVAGTARKANFAEVDHIKDYVNLHRWPKDPSIRYYPVNFADYGWLPKPDANPDEPMRPPRPRGMRPAH